MNKKDALQNYVSMFLSGYTLSKAMMEDYARTMAKIEGVTEEEVTKRVRGRAEELMKEIRDEARQVEE